MADSELPTPKRRPSAELAMIAVVLIWGVNIPLMKYALDFVGVYLFNSVRLTFSSLSLLGLFLFRRKIRANSFFNGKELSNRRLWVFSLLAYAFVGGFLYQYLFLAGVNSTTAGNTGLILAAIPMWTAILAWSFLGERIGRRAWIGLLIAFSGVATVTMGAGGSEGPALSWASSNLKGNLLISAAALSWATISIGGRVLMRKISPLALALISVSLALPLHYWMAIDEFNQLEILLERPLVLAIIVFSGVFSTGLAPALWNYSVKNLGPSRAAGFQNLVPLVALLASWFLLAEMPLPLQLAGGVLIISGMLFFRHFANQLPPSSGKQPD